MNVIIGGITGGIGSKIAERLSAEGHSVIGFSHTKEKTEAFSNDHPNIPTDRIDAEDPKALNEYIETKTKELGSLDAYVHAIGSILLKPGHLISDDEFENVMNLNVKSAFYGLRAAVKPMMAQKNGSVLLFSSVASKVGIPNHEAIAAAKGAINGLTLSAAATYAKNQVRVNAIAPSLVETPGSAEILSSDQARKVSESMHPIGRFGQPEDVASLANWLISDEASWVTGQIYGADGGMGSLMQRPKLN